MPAKSPLPPIHTAPSPIEQEHIRQALEASETAIEAIGAVVSFSSWALGIIGLGVAIIAVVGWSAIKRMALDRVGHIANERFDAYMKSEVFDALMQSRIDLAVRANWEDAMLQRFHEAVRPPNDDSPFPPKDAGT